MGYSQLNWCFKAAYIRFKILTSKLLMIELIVSFQTVALQNLRLISSFYNTLKLPGLACWEANVD